MDVSSAHVASPGIWVPVRCEWRHHAEVKHSLWAAEEGLEEWEAGSPTRLSFNEQTHKDLEAINPELGLQNQTWPQLPLGTGERKRTATKPSRDHRRNALSCNHPWQQDVKHPPWMFKGA